MPPWMRPIAERLSPMIRNIIIVEAVIFALYVMAAPLRERITSHLGLGPRLLSGEVWQLITSLFVHTDALNFIFTLIGLWFVGATIERVFGRRRFILLFFGTGLVANLVITGVMILFSKPLYGEGCGDSVLALFVAFGVAYGRTPTRVLGPLVLQARVLAWVFVGWAVLALMLQLPASWPYLVSTLIAQGVAYLLAGGKVGVLSEFFAGVQGKPRTKFDVLDGGRRKDKDKYVN